MIARLMAAALMLMASAATSARAQVAGQPVRAVVELYTSQGCPQCRRANRLLGAFAQEQDVLALTFSVGMWDYLGWQDTFAQPEFGDRQREYSHALRVRGRFTPQLVINGARQLSAADWDDARAVFDAEIGHGLPQAASLLTLTRLENGRVRVAAAPNVAGSAGELWLVAYDPGPLNVRVTAGLNVNRSVSHYNLALRIERLGRWSASTQSHERGWCRPACAVLLQEPSGGRVLAASVLPEPY